ncbi:hypothetical protein N431DRAFT_289751, partial [Stipitochalara longipes BDJ]
SLIATSLKLTFYKFVTDLPPSFWLSSISALGFVYVAGYYRKKNQRLADETQNIQRTMTELQDRMLQQEVSSQDQFLQLHAALDDNHQNQEARNTPHKDAVKLDWKKGRIAGLERTTSTRKNSETIRINQK